MVDDASFIYPSINLAVLLKPGTIAKIEGLSDVYQLEDVVSINLIHAEKDTIEATGNYSHILLRINMVSPAYESLCDSVAKVNALIKVTSTEGEDMLVSRFDLRAWGR